MEGHDDRTTHREYPVGVLWANDAVQPTPAHAVYRERVCRDFQLPSSVRLGVGVDRLDYTEGINKKFLAIERLLNTCPELRGQLVFLQVAEPSPDCLPAYGLRVRNSSIPWSVSMRASVRAPTGQSTSWKLTTSPQTCIGFTERQTSAMSAVCVTG